MTTQLTTRDHLPEVVNYPIKYYASHLSAYEASVHEAHTSCLLYGLHIESFELEFNLIKLKFT